MTRRASSLNPEGKREFVKWRGVGEGQERRKGGNTK